MTKPKPKSKLAVKPAVPLCADCRWYRLRQTANYTYPKCGRGTMVHPVSGEDVVLAYNTDVCIDLRRSLCGPQGIYWEAKA